MDNCIWIYRPGTNGLHLAISSCDHKIKYLSKITENVPQSENCADEYNNRLCPTCGKVIQLDYSILH